MARIRSDQYQALARICIHCVGFPESSHAAKCRRIMPVVVSWGAVRLCSTPQSVVCIFLAIGSASLPFSPLDVTREIQHWTVLHLQHVLRVSSGLVFVGGACSRSRLLAGFHRIVPYAGLPQSIRAWAIVTSQPRCGPVFFLRLGGVYRK